MNPKGLSAPVAQAIDASFDTQRFYFTPTDQQLGGLSVSDYRELFLNDLGMGWDSYLGFVSAAAAYNCLVLVRKTNQGVIHGFTKGKNVTGKTLATKLKSSEYPPIQSNLGFFTFLSKKAVTDRLNKPNDTTYWTTLVHDQEHLDEIVHGRDAVKHTVDKQSFYDQTFIPKYLPWPAVHKLTGINGAAPAWIAQQYTPALLPSGATVYNQAASASAIPALANPALFNFSTSRQEASPTYKRTSGMS